MIRKLLTLAISAAGYRDQTWLRAAGEQSRDRSARPRLDVTVEPITDDELDRLILARLGGGSYPQDKD